jgi:hypothetical protein
MGIESIDIQRIVEALYAVVTELSYIRVALEAQVVKEKKTGVDGINLNDHTVYKYAVGDMYARENDFMAGPFDSYHEAAQVDAGVLLGSRGLSINACSMYIYKITGASGVGEVVAQWDEHDCRWVAR